MSPLEAATVDELLDELQKRFVALVFAGRTEVMGDTGRGGTNHGIYGPPDMCLGLIDAARIRAQTMYRVEVLADLSTEDEEDEPDGN